jgi:hypothetical protein
LEINFDKGIARVPRFIVALGLLGTAWAGRLGGMPWALAFLAGAIAAWVNFQLIERFVNRLGKLTLQNPAKPPKTQGIRQFIRFAFFILGAFVILRLSGFNVAVAMCGFLVCPAAVLVEIFYELLTYGHS